MKYLISTISLFIFSACCYHPPPLKPDSVCANTSETGQTPLSDSSLTTATYNDSLFGLYDSTATIWTNFTPTTFDSAVIERALECVPRDASGNPGYGIGDTLGVAFMGHSNCEPLMNFVIHTSDSLAALSAAGLLNPKVGFVPGGIATIGHLVNIATSGSQYWTQFADSLSARGITADQISVVFLFSQVAGNSSSWPAYPDSCRDWILESAETIQSQLPNVKVIFLIGAAYGGYKDTGSIEPGSWQSCWGEKWAVDRSIARQDTVDWVKSSSGPGNWSGLAPIIDWAADAYTTGGETFSGDIYANGQVTRADGLDSDCVDFQSDGIHFSTIGARKLWIRLLTFLQNSPKTCWFTKSGITRRTYN